MKICEHPLLAEPVRLNLGAIVFLSALGVLVGFNTLHAPFLYDDAHAIADNPYIEDLSKFQSVVGIENIFNRSVLLLTFALNRHLGGLNVVGFHLVNIWIHIGVSLVFYFLTAKLTALEPMPARSRLAPLPLFAATLHLLHPMTVESVTYLSSRSSLLATFFFVLGLYLFLRTAPFPNADNAKKHSIFGLLGALACFALGTGTKEIIVTLPLLAGAFLWLQTPHAGRKNLLKLGICIAAPFVAYLAYRYWQMGTLLTLKADPDSAAIDRAAYFLTQIRVLVFYYFLKLLLPFNLNFEPDVRLILSVVDWQWIASLCVLTGLTLWAFYQKSNLVRFALLWAFLTVLPTSSLIPLKQIAIEHRAYLPGLGVSLLLAFLVLQTAPAIRSRRKSLFALCVLMACLNLNRGLDYRTETALWQDTANKSPQKALVHNNLGAAYLSEKKYTEAEAAFVQALKLNPAHTDAHVNLGHILSNQKRWQEARVHFDRALLLGSAKPEAYFNAGLVRMRLHQEGEAIPFLEQAVRLKPHRTQYHFHLGNAYRKKHRYDDALNEYRQVLRREPGHPQAHNNTGLIFYHLKNFSLAEPSFKQALALEKDSPKIHNNLASLYLAQNRFQEAAAHLKKLLTLQPENHKARQLLKIAQTLPPSPNP